MPKFNLSNDETDMVMVALELSYQGLMQHGLCDCGMPECGSVFGSDERQEHLAYADALLRLMTRFESRMK